MDLNKMQAPLRLTGLALMALLLTSCASGGGSNSFMDSIGQVEITDEEKAIMLETEKMAQSESFDAGKEEASASVGFKEFLKFLRQNLAKTQKGDPVRNQWIYSSYLKDGEAKYANVYAKRLLRAAKTQKSPLKNDELGLFNDSLCLEQNNTCSYSMSSATEERLIPKLEEGRKEALRLLAVYHESVDIDGEHEKIAALFSDNEKIKPHQKAFLRYRSQAQKFLGFNGQ